MAPYPPKLVLPYRVSRSWLEERTLAGELVEPIHTLEIETDRLSPDFRARAAKIAKQISTEAFNTHSLKTVEVVGSGLDPFQTDVEDAGLDPQATDAITRKIGSLPELPEPTESGEALIEAYERWIRRYLDLALGAQAAWISRWSVDADLPEPLQAAPESWWKGTVGYRVGEVEETLTIDGREDVELFHEIRAGDQLHVHAGQATSPEAMVAAIEIVGSWAQLESPPASAKAAVRAYARHAERLADVAFARHWTAQRQRQGFDLEMRRWAFEHGSERLRMGITDNYRMVPVYLEERIGAEVPRFYAHLPKKNDEHAWQPRTGPSEEALRLRRAVQQRLEEVTPAGMAVPTAEIGWMKNPPEAMVDENDAFDWTQDYEGNRYRNSEMYDCAFEIIAVRGWLDRYTLMAGVYTHADGQPADFLLLRYVLNPKDYGLEGMPDPPDAVSVAAWSRIGTGDFETAPVAGAADDDIPF